MFNLLNIPDIEIDNIESINDEMLQQAIAEQMTDILANYRGGKLHLIMSHYRTLLALAKEKRLAEIIKNTANSTYYNDCTMCHRYKTAQDKQCIGYAISENDDEPCEKCKQCPKQQSNGVE